MSESVSQAHDTQLLEKRQLVLIYNMSLIYNMNTSRYKIAKRAGGPVQLVTK